jgi:hypothetical protein
MAWTTPGTAVAGEVLTAAFWNEQVRDNMAVLRALANVKQTVKTDTFSTNATSFTDVTGLSVTITPTSSTSKIMVIADIALSADVTGYGVYSIIVRNSTEIYIGDAAGNREQALSRIEGNISNQAYSTIRTNGIYLDSPATTSAVTYKLQVKSSSASYNAYVNRSAVDSDTVTTGIRTASSITVWEIPA